MQSGNNITIITEDELARMTPEERSKFLSQFGSVINTSSKSIAEDLV